MTEKKKEKAGVSMEVLGVSTLNIDLKNWYTLILPKEHDILGRDDVSMSHSLLE